MHKLVQNDKSSKENLNYFAFLDSLPLLKISMAHLLGNHPRILSSQLTLSPYSQCLKMNKNSIKTTFLGHYRPGQTNLQFSLLHFNTFKCGLFSRIKIKSLHIDEN